MCSTSRFLLCILSTVLFLNCCLLHGVAVDADSRSSSSDVNSNRALRIDITRKRSIQFNGVEINENSLLDHLEDHERELIFGKDKTKREVKLVHLRQRTDAAAATATATTTTSTATTTSTLARGEAPQQQQKQHQRVKRSDTAAPGPSGGAPTTQEVLVQIQDDDADLVNLHLRPTPKLIDDAFIFLIRYANSTQLIADSHKLAQGYANCFYSNENSALDLCEEENVRGIIHHNATNFIIHPLPPRFGNSTHVIVTASNENASYHDLVALPPALMLETEKLDPNLQFEPDEEDFNEVKRSTRNIAPTDPQQQQNTTLTTKQHHQQRMLPTSYARSSYQPRYNYEEQTQRHQHQHRQHHRAQLNHSQQYHHFKNHKHHKFHQHHQHQQQHRRRRRYIASEGQWSIPNVLHIETGIFVDRDLYEHMAKNFPTDTKKQLIRFVLAMINGVQLLYHHPSLGRRVNFVLKRLEILFEDPPDLGRHPNIDTYLSNFCVWQKSKNPASNTDRLHYDHAVILTGLDLFVKDKNGKIIEQVVGLAPVSGMCTPTSSCTINEGKHFESVFVVAHEIGHNLGMRHDTKDNACDPTAYIMSPTLGSGKITWSKCSRNYLDTFLYTTQARCLFIRGEFPENLDHAAEGILPGERFDANQQCMLKYGKNTVRARSQLPADVCRDLHCQHERFTWTSHPALEGTECGDNMWCRSGICELRPSARESLVAAKRKQSTEKLGYDKSSFLEQSKMGHLLQEYNYNKLPAWADWGEASECESGCLYGPSKRLREGSTGLKTYTRRCLDSRLRCYGRDRKFESCIAKQCYSIQFKTIEKYATEVCEKSIGFDADLTGEGTQIIGNSKDSCMIFCKTKTNSTKSRRTYFPDGTTCRFNESNYDDTAYCIAGRCERFTCDNSTNNYFKIDPIFCQYRKPGATQAPTPPAFENNRRWSGDSKKQLQITYSRYADNSSFRNRGVINGPTTVRSKYENEVAIRSNHGTQRNQDQYKRKSDTYQAWNKYNYQINEQRAVPASPAPPPPPPSPQQLPRASAPVSASLIMVPPESEWTVKSGCHSSCMARSRGIQVVTSRRTGANNIQLCAHVAKPCERLQTATEYAENTCARYKLKVRGLSGHGTQIAASIDEPDRSCRVGCQDEYIKYRYYLVNGKYGHFPLGTKCSHTEERYCVNGKCLEFGPDNIPLQQSHISLALFRKRRALPDPMNIATASRPEQLVPQSAKQSRTKRSYLYYAPVNITETITQEFINNIINSIIEYDHQQVNDDLAANENDHIDLKEPIHVSTDELSMM